MKHVLTLAIALTLAVPINLAAFDHSEKRDRTASAADAQANARKRAEEMRIRLNLPVRFPLERDDRKAPSPPRPEKPGHRPEIPKHRRVWSYPSTVVREVQPVIVVTPSQPEPQTSAEPEVQRVWVPPVMGTRTEPGHWDYGIKKTWMGDHWRFEQDFTQKAWVPPTQVEYVKQEGYWDIVR